MIAGGWIIQRRSALVVSDCKKNEAVSDITYFMKLHFNDILVFPVPFPFGLDVFLFFLPAKITKQVLSTERNRTKKRILHQQELLLLEKIGT
jgi:hypothetical protein